MVITADGITIDRPARTISHRGRSRTWGLTGVRKGEDESIRFKTMVHLILGGGMSTHQIFWCLYANDPEGGPLSGPRLLDVVFQVLKPAIRELDLEMRTRKIAGVVFHELVPTHQLRMANAAE